LKALRSGDGSVFAGDLSELIRQPKIVGINAAKSSFNSAISSNYGPVQLLTLDPLNTQLAQANGSNEFTMKFMFDSKIDVKSVMDVTNWRISKASNSQKGGLYDNGLYRPTDTAVPALPIRVSYNSESREATVVF